MKYILVFLPFILLYMAFNSDSVEYLRIKGFLLGEEKPAYDWVEKKYQDTLKNYFKPEPDWHPNGELNAANQPDLVAQGALLVDMSDGDILVKKNIDEKREIASLVKIMTAVVALEHKNLEDYITVSESAASIGENSMGLTMGEAYKLEELLYGLVLASGNDAAYAIAEGVGGDMNTFVRWMNMKASELGLKNSYFADPSGLDDTSYSTPEDLIKLTRYALKNESFKKIVGTLEIELISDTHKYVYLYNQTNLLSTYPGVAGVKTGFTEEAGLCLVTYAVNGDKELVGVVLNSNDRKGDMILMLDHGFFTLGVLVEHSLL